MEKRSIEKFVKFISRQSKGYLVYGAVYIPYETDAQGKWEGFSAKEATENNPSPALLCGKPFPFLASFSKSTPTSSLSCGKPPLFRLIMEKSTSFPVYNVENNLSPGFLPGSHPLFRILMGKPPSFPPS